MCNVHICREMYIILKFQFNDSINYRLLSQAYVYFAIAWLFLDHCRCDINHTIVRVPNQFCTIILAGRDHTALWYLLECWSGSIAWIARNGICTKSNLLSSIWPETRALDDKTSWLYRGAVAATLCCTCKAARKWKIINKPKWGRREKEARDRWSD